MAGGMTRRGSELRDNEAACGCGSPGFAHYPSLHPGRDQPVAARGDDAAAQADADRPD